MPVKKSNYFFIILNEVLVKPYKQLTTRSDSFLQARALPSPELNFEIPVLDLKNGNLNLEMAISLRNFISFVGFSSLFSPVSGAFKNYYFPFTSLFCWTQNSVGKCLQKGFFNKIERLSLFHEEDEQMMSVYFGSSAFRNDNYLFFSFC